jgi:hypothetical protein
MGIRTRLALGVALAATPVALLASPAAADSVGEDTERQEFTFSYQGVERTCALNAHTRYRYLDDRDLTIVSAWTLVEGPEECAAVLLEISVTVRYQNANGVEELNGASSRGDYVDTVFTEQGALTGISGTHDVVYRCDPPWVDSCETLVTTNPK